MVGCLSGMTQEQSWPGLHKKKNGKGFGLAESLSYIYIVKKVKKETVMTSIREQFENATQEFKFKAKYNVWGEERIREYRVMVYDGGVKSIWYAFNGMNVKSFTKQGIMLYTFDMLGNKTTGKIKWSDILRIEPIEETK